MPILNHSIVLLPLLPHLADALQLDCYLLALEDVLDGPKLSERVYFSQDSLDILCSFIQALLHSSECMVHRSYLLLITMENICKPSHPLDYPHGLVFLPHFQF